MMTRRIGAVVSAVSFVAVVSSCAGIPSSGQVERVADDSGLTQSTVRYEPVGPSRGASPQQIVRGYLDAMLAYPVSTGTAASYLTPDAAEEWRSSDGVTVYSKPEVTLPHGARLGSGRTGLDVLLRADEVARLDRQGHYRRSAEDPDHTYHLEQVKGEWRITNPQDGVMVTRTYYNDYFRPLPLYFFDAAGERLVPDLVHLAVGEQLPTGLVTNLARGPARTLGKVRSYVPAAGALRPSVTVGAADVADVEFSTSLASLSSAERDRLAAQIVWTLRSVPGLRGVRILGGSAILSANGDRVQPIDSWGGFGPPTADDQTYALVGDKLVEVNGAAVRPATGAWGRDANGAVDVAVSAAAVAAVLAGRDQVRITDRAGAKPTLVEGSEFIAPRWDHDNRLWLLDRSSGATRVRIVEDRKPRTLKADSLRGLDVTSFALSPDDTRYAVTGLDDGQASIYVGPVERDGKDRIVDLGEARRLSAGVDSPHSVGWESTTRVGFLGASDAGTQLYSVAIDSTDLTGGDTGGGPLLPDVGAATLSAGPAEDAGHWVVDARRRLWYLPPRGSWRLIDDRAFVGLSTGR